MIRSSSRGRRCRWSGGGEGRGLLASAGGCGVRGLRRPALGVPVGVRGCGRLPGEVGSARPGGRACVPTRTAHAGGRAEVPVLLRGGSAVGGCGCGWGRRLPALQGPPGAPPAAPGPVRPPACPPPVVLPGRSEDGSPAVPGQSDGGPRPCARLVGPVSWCAAVGSLLRAAVPGRPQAVVAAGVSPGLRARVRVTGLPGGRSPCPGCPWGVGGGPGCSGGRAGAPVPGRGGGPRRSRGRP